MKRLSMQEKKERLENLKIKTFGEEVLKACERAVKRGIRAEVFTDSLIQIVCGIAFESLGVEEGKKFVLLSVEGCIEHAKNNP